MAVWISVGIGRPGCPVCVETGFAEVHTTESLLKKIGLPPLSYFVGVRKLRWLGELQRMPFERRARQLAFGFLPGNKGDGRSKWRTVTLKVLKEAVEGVAKMPTERRALQDLIVSRLKTGGIAPLRKYKRMYERMMDANFGDVLPPAYEGSADNSGIDWDHFDLSKDDDFIKFTMDNWQIIAEDQEKFEVELMAGLKGANVEALARNYERRDKAERKMRQKFGQCDELRTVLKTGDKRLIQEVREKHRRRKQQQERQF